MHKADDGGGRGDFMAAGHADGSMPVKPGSTGWDADEAARIKSSMMNRDKIVSLMLC